MKRAKAIKLTVAEKQARGTNQTCREAVRPLAEVQEEMQEQNEALADMRFNLHAAGKAIRTQGVLIAVITRSNDNKEVRTQKLNPACKLQKEMLSAIKSVKRALVLLREEEAAALKAEKPLNDEFEGL